MDMDTTNRLLRAGRQGWRLPFLCCLAWCLGAAGIVRADAPVNDVVGEIITVIGEGRVIGSAGQSAAARGRHVRAGDVIETAAGGHVHIRFVDGALVSVRPYSRLSIDAYRNATGGELAAIKFRLERGVMRSVSGEWGEAHRDRFRLNTPIAAIGIKGTDFVVKADQASAYATVLSGAIVMAPLEGECAATLGPCKGEQALALSAEMTGKMLEMLRENGHIVPRLVPATDLLAKASSAARAPGATELTDSAEKERLKDSAAADLAQNVLETGTAGTTGKPLVWLHNPQGWGVPANSISQRFDEALAAGRRAVVGNFFITLHRDESVLKSFQPLGTRASFVLTAASATFTLPVAYDRPTENVQVSNATLNVDFQNARFDTRLDLASPSLGRDTLQAGGSVTTDGLLLASSPGQKLAGAFSLDGRQAGYLFDKNVAGGILSGLTLWGR